MTAASIAPVQLAMERASTPCSPLPASQWKGRIPGLDGIRALSFLLVFVSHTGFMGTRPGGFAVGVFFIVSGYLITTLLIKEHDRTGTISLRSFYFRRTLRIFPCMYATLIVCALLAHRHWLSIPLKPGAMLFEAAYLGNYAFWWQLAHGTHGYYVDATGQFWSLCVEEHFYLLFPILFLLMLRRRLTYRAISRYLLAICLAALAWRFIAVRLVPLGEEYCYMATDARLDSILWGCLLATMEQQEKWRNFFSFRRLAWLMPFCLAILIATFVFHDTGRMTARFTLQSIALLPIIYFASHFPQFRFTRLLNHPILVHIGTLSYALYLIHAAAIETVSRYVPHKPLILWPVCGLVAYLAALALHWGIERPFLSLRNRS